MQNNFNFVAPFYDALSRVIFGQAIKKSQVWLLPFVPENAHVLIIGGGTGWILTKFLNQTNCRRILYLEASENMLDLSKKRYAESVKKPGTEVEFRLGTEADLKPDETFEVIFTGFLLDLFQKDPLHGLMVRLNEALDNNGLWLLADFQPTNARQFWQKMLLKTMVTFFKVTANLQANRLPNLEVAFLYMPLQMQEQQLFYKGLIRSAVYRK